MINHRFQLVQDFFHPPSSTVCKGHIHVGKMFSTLHVAIRWMASCRLSRGQGLPHGGRIGLVGIGVAPARQRMTLDCQGSHEMSSNHSPSKRSISIINPSDLVIVAMKQALPAMRHHLVKT